jgi:glycerophosphoryl diester phosphodiesterase
VAEARRVAPGVPRGVLETSYHLAPMASLASVAGRDLWQYVEMVDTDLVQTVHGFGGRVIAWTVNAAADIERLAAIGVDGLCTNHVGLARSVLGR